jgi:hypothetical protein
MHPTFSPDVLFVPALRYSLSLSPPILQRGKWTTDRYSVKLRLYSRKHLVKRRTEVILYYIVSCCYRLTDFQLHA